MRKREIEINIEDTELRNYITLYYLKMCSSHEKRKHCTSDHVERKRKSERGKERERERGGGR